MRFYKIVNKETGKTLWSNAAVAATFWQRFIGLMGRRSMADDEALVFYNVWSFHTFFMKFPIDVIFLNKKNQVIATIENLQPNRITRLYPKAVSVLELPAGTIEKTSTVVGDEIEIK